MIETATRPSRAPEALPKRGASRQVTRAAKRKATSQSTCCSQLVARCTVKADAESKAFYAASLASEVAIVRGQRVGARTAVGEWITVASKLVRWVLAGKVPGYGAARFNYAAELALSIANEASSEGDAPTDEGVASATKSGAENTEAIVRKVSQALRNLGIKMKARTRGRTSAVSVAVSLEDLASAVLRARTTIPAAVMADAGLTQAVIDALDAAAQRAMTRHTTGIVARSDELSAARGEDMLIGRLMREIRLLAASSRVAHRDDPAVPAVRCSLLASSKKSAKKSDASPVTPPAGPPSPR